MSVEHVLSYGFIQRALIAGTCISALCAVLGLFLVLRRFSLIGDGLAHVTFGSAGLSLFLGMSPLWVSIPIVCVSSLGIMKLVSRERVYGDAAIGIVSSLGIASGVLIASLAGGFNVNLFSFLFGSILVISWTEVLVCAALSLTVIAVVVFFYRDLFSVTFDEELAAISGVKAGRINRILAVLTALTVVLAMRVVGVLLVSSLLIMPAVTALQVARSFRFALLLAAGIAVFSLVAGIFVSFLANLPTGATIVLVNFLFLLVSFFFKK